MSDTTTAREATVHGCPPDDSALTACCGRTVFELPRSDRLSCEPAEVTCPAAHRCDSCEGFDPASCPFNRITIAPPACASCRRPFDPTDDRFDGRAQHRNTPWCRGCVDRCHDSENADHRCRVCFTDPFTQEG